MENYTHKRCSEFAEDILSTHGFLDNKKLPIDIEILSEKLGYRVRVLNTLGGIKGTGYRKLPEDRYEILVDSSHYINNHSSQFTISEELSHLLIHEEIFRDIHTIDDRIEFERTLSEEDHQKFEMQAKRLANYLLLPSSLFFPSIEEWVKNNTKLIDIFYYSSSDMYAKELGILTKDYYNISQFVIQKALYRYYSNGIQIAEYLLNKYKPTQKPR